MTKLNVNEHFLTRIQRDAANFRTRGFIVEATDPERVRETIRHVLNPCEACAGPTTNLVRRRAPQHVAKCDWCGNEQAVKGIHRDQLALEEGEDEYSLPKERVILVDPFKSLVESIIQPMEELCCSRPMSLTGTPGNMRMVCQANSGCEMKEPVGRVVEVGVDLPNDSPFGGSGNVSSEWAGAMSQGTSKAAGRSPGAPALTEPIAPQDKHLRAAYELAGGFQQQPDPTKNRCVVLIQAYMDPTTERVMGLTHFLRSVAVDDTIMDVGSTFVVFTHNAGMIGEAARKVCETIVAPISNQAERRRIIEDIILSRVQTNNVAARMLNGKLTNETFDYLAKITGGLNLDQTSAAIIEMLNECENDIDVDYLAKLKSRKVTETGLVRLLETLPGGFDDIGGYEWVKDGMRRNITMRIKHAKLAKKYGLGVPKGIILFGPGGTGKTLLARGVSAETRLPVIEVEEFKSKFVGESEANLRRIFGIANSMAPCIVFIDEIDKMGNREGASMDNTGVNQALFSMFLVELQRPDREWMLMGCTNKPHVLDSAFLRPGRIDTLAPLLWPEPEARREILRIHMRNMEVDTSQVDLNALAAKTRWFTGAEIMSLVQRVGQNLFIKSLESGTEEEGEESLTMAPVTTEEFLEEVEAYGLNPPVSEREAEFKAFMDYARDHCNDKRLWKPYEQLVGLEEAWAAEHTKNVARPMRNDAAVGLRTGNRRTSANPRHTKI